MSADVPEALRAMLDALPDGVFVHDPRGTVVYANPAFAAFLGTAEAIAGRSGLDLVHPGDRDAVRDRIRAGFETKAPTPRRAIRFLRPDGSCVEGETRSVPFMGGPEGNLIVVVRDLTERRLAERALENSNALFRTLIEDLKVGVLVQGPGAEVLVSNRAALDLLGIDEATLLGKRTLDSDWHVTHEDGTPFPPQERPGPTAIRTRRAVHDVVMGIDRPRHQDRIWLLVNADPQLDANGDVLQLVCTFSDFTERRRMQSQLVAGDRLASMGRLAASVAHEINNPLSYVIGHLEAMRSASLEDAVAPKVEAALEGAARVRAIVDDLRRLTRGGEERHGGVDLGRVVHAACSISAGQIRHRARMVHDLAAVSKVLGTEVQLGQLVLNLVVNAAEAIPEGRAADNEVRVSVRPGIVDGSVILEVSDTGTGIAPSDIDRIFDPFFTTKPVGVGTGLGLSVCHAIVTSLGGTIAVTSKVGEGSTFRVELPASASDGTQAVTSATAPVVVRSRILVVDDDEAVANMLAGRLRRKHDVRVEVQAISALERLLGGEHYDVVLCDLMMPDMTGMDFLDALERGAPDMARRTVFMTGGAFTTRAQAFLDRHPTRCLEKPFDMTAVDGAIAHVTALGSS